MLIDRLELSGPRILLMVALAYRRRALPLTWTVIKKRGLSLSADQVRLLQRLEQIIPDGGQVVLIGDGEFRGVPLLVWLVSAGWDFILRAHLDLPVYLPTGQRRQIHELAFKQNGEPQEATIRLPLGYYPIYAARHRDARGWAYVTSNTRAYGSLTRRYRRRMQIEELFADLEGGGFQLQRSRLYKPERLSRLLLPLCWVYAWLTHVGG